MTEPAPPSRTAPASPEDPLLWPAYLRLKAAVHDPNTSLDAAAAVLESVRAMFQRTRTVGIIHVAIDPASRVEGVYGWQVLDSILRSVARDLDDLRGESIPAGSIVCQSLVCSDRFLIFLPLARGSADDPSGPLAEAGRAVLDRIEERFAGSEYQSMTPRPAIDVGVSSVTEHPFFRLERQIEKGIDDARAAGSREREPERARQHAELKRIIRDQQIETLFQPIVELESGHIIGYEAFTRGPADTAFTMPDSLFACSRDAGMSGELDRLCQRSALRKARLLAPGHKLFLNALADSLLDPGFREGLLADLPADFPIQRGDIVLEIADRNTIADDEAFGAEVDDLRACGFRMSIDDVGKGATSLESLSQIRPDFIKVDTSLIHKINENFIKQELLRSLCQVARTMNAQVIVEGIETQEELDAVRRCGAKLGQGYLFQRPSRDIRVAGFGQVHPGM